MSEVEKNKDSRKKIPVRRCAAFGCPVTSVAYPHVKLFNFPKQQDGKLIRYQKWVEFCNNPKLSTTKNLLLCSFHFSKKQFINSKRAALHCKAIPTIPTSKFIKCKPVKTTIQTELNPNCSNRVSNNTSNLVAFNANSYFLMNHNLNLTMSNTSDFNNCDSDNEIEDTNMAVNVLSKLLGKPPDIASHVLFDKWLTFAKKQNIICDQVDYALSTAKQQTDFLRPNSPDINSEPFYGFSSNKNLDSVLLETTK